MLIFKVCKRVVNMMKTPVSHKLQVGVATVLMTFGVAHNAYSAPAPAQQPLFQTNAVKPIMMLNMSKDHQMFFKAYDDYSNITDDSGGGPDDQGIPDRTYVPKYEYYGYFDGKLCYQYIKDYFNPVALADAEHYCEADSDQWSGNFLNWASMTRIDAIRKILYGGYRSTDTATDTILERAFLPYDAHAFAKFYNGPKINQLTPFTVPTTDATPSKNGITICNVTPADVAAKNASQLNTQPPLLRVAKGNYSLWASNEGKQCEWDGAGNSNVAASGIDAYPTAPSGDGHKLIPQKTGAVQYAKGEYVARVKVCVPIPDPATAPEKYINKDECKKYSTVEDGPQKPIGLFQEFGETDKILFGLLTGSYGKNKSGGVLRKTVGSMANEINTTTGEFLINSSDGPTRIAAAGAISVLNSLRIYGYSYSDKNYSNSAAGYDNCPFGLAGFNNGSCTNWGNPQAEIYLESLRYLAGKSANPDFAVTGTDKVPGVTAAAWGTPPVTSANYCAPLNVLQFNTSSSTFDDDEMSTATDLGLSSDGVKTWTNTVGDVDHQALSGSYFVGTKVGGTDTGDQNGICTGKAFSLLSAFTGSCPDAPRLGGSYGIAGLAYYARTNGINTIEGKAQTVRTFGVSLAPAVPAIKILVPGTSGEGKTKKYIEVLPACKNEREATAGSFAGREGNCAIVDFKIVNMDITDTNTTNTAKLYVNWEVAEQGNDYDQDMWGTIDISVTNTVASVTTRILNMSATPKIGFGYVISGTKNDGFKVSSGAFKFKAAGTYCDDDAKCNCPNGACAQVSPAQPYLVAQDDDDSTNATFLPSALELAAKWGGFSLDFEKAQKAEALKQADADFFTKQIKARDYKDSYYFATNPRELAKSLRDAFNYIAAGVGAASSVATVSARVDAGSLVYQAQFNSKDWSGDLLAYEFDKVGSVVSKPKYCTSTSTVSGKECTGSMATDSSTRTIYTNNGTTGLVSLDWSNLTQIQKNGLRLLSEATVVLDPTEATYANAKKRLDWLSGNATHEEATSGGILRNRGTDANRNILGDIVNSSPVYVGARNLRYESLPGNAGADYKEFLGDKQEMPAYIVVGSNDGMVHAFNATTLAEMFAFIPSKTFLREEVTDEGTKLTNLTSPTYGVSSSNPHAYSVDGPITYGDVYIKVGLNKKWRRIVVGTLGAGGRGIYALDVTESTPKLLFELSASDYPALGYVIGKPIIAPMQNGRWAVIFGNGSHSGSASHLFVVDVEAPTNSDFTKVISAGEGTGLSAPSLLLDGVGQALTAYAGDIDGNLWRFNLNNTDPQYWVKDYKLFKAITTASTPTNIDTQPITGAPTLGVNAKKDFKTMVYFGTGKYYDVGDGASNIPKQSFYAILDTGSEVARSTLLQKTMTTTDITSRTVSTTNPNWDTQNGWYLDFDYSDAKGERVTTKPLLLFDKLIFPTLIPTTFQCDAGGGSWLMEIPAIGDKYVNVKILKNNLYTNSLVLGNLNFVSVEGGGSIVKNQSDGVVKTVPAAPPQPLEGRESWRQIQ